LLIPNRDKKFVSLALFFSDAKAVTAIHELKLQIKEHQTGDALKVK
jgi:hypothetical protein